MWQIGMIYDIPKTQLLTNGQVLRRYLHISSSKHLRFRTTKSNVACPKDHGSSNLVCQDSEKEYENGIPCLVQEILTIFKAKQKELI